VLRENDELKPSESDVGGLLSDLVEGARRATSFAQQPRGLRAHLESVPRLGAALNIDPRSLPFPEALEIYQFLRKDKGAASLK